MENSLLLFDEGGAYGAADVAACMPGNRLLGVKLVNASSCMFEFAPANNRSTHRTEITVSFTSGTFKQAMQAIAGALNSNTMVVVADARNNVFLEYAGGSFNGTSLDVDENA